MKNVSSYKARKLPYRWKITLVILIFTMVPSSIFGITYYKNTQAKWVKSALASYYIEAEYTSLLLSNTLNDLRSKMNYLINNSTIRTLINRVEYLTLPLSIDMVSELENAVSAISADSPDLAIRWYPLDSTLSYGRYCYPLHIFTDEFDMENEADLSLYQQITNLESETTMWAFRDISRDVNNTGPVEKRLCFYTQIGDYGVVDCILEMSIPIEQFITFEGDDIIPNSLFAVYIPQSDQDLHMIWNASSDVKTDTELLIQYHKFGSIPDYFVVSTPVPNAKDSAVIFALPDDYVASLIRPQLTIFILLTVLVAGVLIFVVYLTSHLLTRQYEINTLRMELELLQLRFNPHLLYNTLNALCCQIKNPTAISTIGSLCQYYRIVLNNGHLVIPVKDEIEMIREYLRIECYAYALNNIRIEYDISDVVLDASIIKHLLQPIVENAIHHGLRPLDQPGILRISVTEDNDHILFKISDNGIGMSSEKVQELLLPPKQNVKGGYGIYNVQQRIRTYYGKQYGLVIDSNYTTGTTISFRIPAIDPTK